MTRAYRVNSEFGRLQAVLLYRPCAAVGNVDDPRAVLHRRKIRYSVLEEEYRQIIRTYEKLGVRVHLVNSYSADRDHDPGLFNMMFARDLFFMTPRGAVVARMFSPVRRSETARAGQALRGVGVRIRKTIGGRGTFEGADALWLSGSLVVVGVGNRTNREGFRQLSGELRRDGITCVDVPAPSASLHLLGSVQVAGKDRAVVRIGSVDPVLPALLERNGIRVIGVPESAEVRDRQAMNFVVLSPGAVIMPSACPLTARILKRAGIEIAATVPVSQLVNAGGGLACATGIMARS